MSKNILRRPLVALPMAVLPLIAAAQGSHDYTLDNAGDAVTLDQPGPDYPGDRVRRGQEGWVMMSYVVTEDGRAIDPIVLDSSGGGSFEAEARKVLPKWRFEPREAESPYNVVKIRSEIRRGRDAATSNFIRRTRRIVTHLYEEEYDMAREQADSAYALGGWNLYESTMLWMMLGRVEGAEGNPAGKLEMYTRAGAMGNARALKTDDRVELLEKIFLLEVHLEHRFAALATYEALKTLRGSDEAVARIEPRVETIRRTLDAEDTIAARATVFSPCDCEDGEPLWHYIPGRRTFSFDNVNGNVERFEARCERHRISGPASTGTRWTLQPDWGHCRVIVFGDDGSTFDFLEHRVAGDNSAADIAVARNHVLDSGNRSQRSRGETR